MDTLTAEFKISMAGYDFRMDHEKPDYLCPCIHYFNSIWASDHLRAVVS